MTVAFALRHVPFEDLGLIEEELIAHGFEIRYLDVPREPLDIAGLAEAPLVIVLGGPIGVYEETRYPFLTSEIAMLQRRLGADRPTLGICLGSQLMARALGARVYPGPEKEIGWSPLTLTEAGKRSCLAPLGNGIPVLHWHGDTFDLPDGTVHLARNALYQNQAFAFGRSLALQFHLEVTRAGLEGWFVGHACEIGGMPGLTVEELRRISAENTAALDPIARRCFADWLEAVGLTS